jgi:hypothetical protein
MARISPALAQRLAEYALDDEDKSQEELIVELQKLRAAVNKYRHQSQNRGKRIKEMENTLDQSNRLTRALIGELRRYRTAPSATATERGSITPIRRAV